MAKEKYYFKNEDAETCYFLQHLIDEAKEDGLTEIELIEAIPDNINKDYIFCSENGTVGEKQQCNKRDCEAYIPVKGKGCEHRGHLFLHGEKVKFKVK